MKPRDKAKLDDCLKLYLDGVTGAEDFCAAFESLYIFEIDHHALTVEESESLQILMTVVAFYSDREDATWLTARPGHRSAEQDILALASALMKS